MSRDPSRLGGPRAGAVLIIVTGLAMVLLGIAVTFMLRMRADSQETRIIVAEAQGRIMLHAALMYLQEGSRLGWGEETFGWTDVRDGSLGPRPPRNLAGTIPPPSWWTNGVYNPFPDDLALPAPISRVWPCPGSVVRCPMAVPVQPPYATQLRYSYNPVGFPAGAPAYDQPNWETPWVTGPLPGAVDLMLRDKDPTTGGLPLKTSRYWPVSWADSIFDPNKGATAALDPQPQADKWHDAGYTGAPGQTPDFISGAIQPGVAAGDWTHVVNDGVTTRKVQLQVREGSENICWFRVYREIQGDHDGNGVPDYDRVVMYDARNPALKNWNVFIIGCGVGPTRGYRFWDQADLGTWITRSGLPANSVTLGQEFAADSGLFASQGDFEAARAATRVMWFRVEWSPLQGGGFIPEKYSWRGMRIYPRKDPWPSVGGGSPIAYPMTAADPSPYPMMTPGPYPGWQAYQNIVKDEMNSDVMFGGASEGGYADGLGYSAPKTFGGNFRWVQRLDHEPPNW
jgi:hypothetical protein